MGFLKRILKKKLFNVGLKKKIRPIKKNKEREKFNFEFFF